MSEAHCNYRPQATAYLRNFGDRSVEWAFAFKTGDRTRSASVAYHSFFFGFRSSENLDRLLLDRPRDRQIWLRLEVAQVLEHLLRFLIHWDVQGVAHGVQDTDLVSIQ